MRQVQQGATNHMAATANDDARRASIDALIKEHAEALREKIFLNGDAPLLFGEPLDKNNPDAMLLAAYYFGKVTSEMIADKRFDVIGYVGSLIRHDLKI